MEALRDFFDKRKCEIMINALDNELIAIRKLLNDRPLLPLTLYIKDVQDLRDELKLRIKILETMGGQR